jgi:hypothetical protein
MQRTERLPVWDMHRRRVRWPWYRRVLHLELRVRRRASLRRVILRRPHIGGQSRVQGRLRLRRLFGMCRPGQHRDVRDILQRCFWQCRR